MMTNIKPALGLALTTTALRPLCAAILALFAAPAQSLTTIGSSTIPVILNSDTSYIVPQGATISVTQDAAVAVDGKVIGGVGPVQLFNDGVIATQTSRGTHAITFHVPGALTNEATGKILGVTDGVHMEARGYSSVDNRGDISASAGQAVYFGENAHGSIENYGTFNGGARGAIGQSSEGIVLDNREDVAVYNRAGASIFTGAGDPANLLGVGIRSRASGTVEILNEGLISAYVGGILNEGSGAMQVDNRNTGIIRALTGAGVQLHQNDSLVNRGEISSVQSAAIVLNGNDNRVYLGSGSVLSGKDGVVIQSAGTGNTLTLIETGSEAGTIAAAPGNELAGLISNAGSTWILGSNIALAGTTAATVAVNGDLTLTGTVSQYAGGGTTIGSSGRLTLGAGGASGMVDGDIVNDGALIFNRSDDLTYDKTISGVGNVTQQGSGQLVFTRDQTYSGDTTVSAGALILNNGAQLTNTRQVTVAQGATFGGYGGVGGSVVNNGLLAVADAAPGFEGGPAGNFVVGGALVNNGEIRMGSVAPASTLTVNGDYTGNNGKLTLFTTLRGDNSPTDMLVVHGNTAGQTTIKVRSAGGIGAPTVNGIRIVQVDGQSNGVFALDGRLVAGAYDYQLFKGGVQTPDDGDWYLRAQGSPVPRPEPGNYLVNRTAAQAMFVHTYRDRTGFADDPRQADGKNVAPTNAWARVSGGHTDGNAARGAVSQWADTAIVQAGIDVLDRVTDNHRWQAGVMAGYGTSTTHATARGHSGTARGTVNGGSAGIYGTWRGNAAGVDGPYVDTWAQYGYFDNTVHGAQLAQENYSSNVWAGSVEAGWALPIGRTSAGVWNVEPQFQLIYSDYQTGDHTESNGTTVQSRNNSGWITRLGTRLFHAPNPDASPQWLPYLELNWWHNTSVSAVAFNNVVIAQDGPRDRVEVKVGAQGQISQRWRMWGNIAYQYGDGGYESITGLMGVRYIW